jgi:hypothetical protein
LLAWDKDCYTERFLALVDVYYNPNWFIATRPLHYFQVIFPYWPLTV